MSRDRTSEQFFIKKAYEISYALFRIAFSLNRESFASRLEEKGLLLLESVASGEFGRAHRTSSVIDYLLRLGSDVGLINRANAETVSRELNHLNSAIAEYDNSAKAEEVQLEDIFSKSLLPVSELDDNQGHARQNGAQKHDENSLGNGNDRRSIVKPAIRQSMILEYIRQNGNLPDRQAGCRMKEIQEIFPGVSERTLRYDLQELIERGFIEKIGNSGPATSYRLNESAFSQDS